MSSFTLPRGAVIEWIGCVVIHHSLITASCSSIPQPSDIVGMILPRLSVEGEHSCLPSLSLRWKSSYTRLVAEQALQIMLWCLNIGKCWYGKLIPQYGFNMKKKSLMEDNTRHRRCTLIGTPKSTSHQWVCCCDKKWWSCTSLFGCNCSQLGS